ncbi:hypothetical protein ALC53_11119 [Atta colombica]|uniref:Uncharacterized protein n=1 Tax=Atta colombica TaxID=520822 RepID=A0A195B2N3_9HYME|nr:hypothetical protein ALC53_11119 [Atta colombica]
MLSLSLNTTHASSAPFRLRFHSSSRVRTQRPDRSFTCAPTCEIRSPANVVRLDKTTSVYSKIYNQPPVEEIDQRFMVCGRRGAEENEKGREKEEKEEEDKENGERKRGGDGGLGGHSKIRFLRQRGGSPSGFFSKVVAILHRLREGQQRHSSHTPSCYWISIGKRLFLSSDRGCHFGSFVTEMENFVSLFLALSRAGNIIAREGDLHFSFSSSSSSSFSSSPSFSSFPSS